MRLSSLSCGRGVTWQLSHPTPSRLPRMKQARRRRRWLSLGRRRSTPTCCASAPRTLVFVGLGHVEGRCTGGTPLSSSRGCGATCQLPPPRPSRLPRVMQVRAPALAISGEETRRSSFHYTCGVALCCGWPMISTRVVAWHVRARHWLWLFLGRERTTRAYCAHAPCCAGCDRLMLPTRTLRW